MIDCDIEVKCLINSSNLKKIFDFAFSISPKSQTLWVYRSYVTGKNSLELYDALQYFLQDATKDTSDYETIRSMLESESFKTETGYALPITNMFATVKM